MDPVTLSRWQFGLTTVYHFLFVPLTLGLGWFVAYMQTRYYQTKDETFRKMANFWGKLFPINFAIGVVTGIVQELQFGMNLGLILPALAQFVSRVPGQKLITQRADIQSQLVDGIQGIADLLAFGRGADRLMQISSTGKAYGSTQRQMARIRSFHSALSTFLTNLGLWLVLLIVIPRVTAGEINGVMLGTFALITLASCEAVTPLPLVAQMWNSSREAAKRLFDIVDADPAVKENEEKQLETSSPTSLQFSNLSFSYPTQSTPVLQDITFTVPAGKSIAIVGPSGAGKSTITNLLLRFREYESGDITLGGESLKALY